MKQISGKEFCRILEKESWELVRIKGSHHIYPVSVPVHGNQPIKIGLIVALIKQARVDIAKYY